MIKRNATKTKPNDKNRTYCAPHNLQRNINSPRKKKLQCNINFNIILYQIAS